MKKKIFGLFICILMIAMIMMPLAAGITKADEDLEPSGIFDRAILVGWLFRCNRVGDWYHGQVIRLRWFETGMGDRAGGVCSFPDFVVFKEDSSSLYKIFQFGLGLNTFVFGYFKNFEIF
ncbi:MAG: hypothetical protein KAV40_00615 [Thermoplasmatales archaeon]|nr:hypothetical protein [Thermoplasmatales archaeon]